MAWFLHETIILEYKTNFYFKKTKKDIIVTHEDKEHFEINNFCRFYEKDIISNKVRDPCHLTGK